MHRALLAGLALASLAATFACSVATEDSEPTGDIDQSLAVRADDEWFYGGPMTALDDASAVVSLRGNTVRVTGYVDDASAIADLPHLRLTPSGGRTRVDAVYPIATARPGKSNSSPGTYAFYEARPYRPDGQAVTIEEGDHFVPWGGFPFLAYNGGIAFHGPITSELGKTRSGQVWFLRRGQVSGGCNRMNGEHVVELAHILGLSMLKVYEPNGFYTPATKPPVTVIADYDTFEGKYVDVDYPTDVGVTRPAKIYGADQVEMFGSWIATSLPDGRDLPRDLQWEGGISGHPYVFAEHARTGMVCALDKSDRLLVKAFAKTLGGTLPTSFCEKKDCVVSTLRAGGDAQIECGL